MSRLPTPASIETSPAASQPLLQAVKKQFGVVPNLFRLVGNSPAALEGYLGLNGALGKGALEAPTRARIALAVAEVNGCDYCLSAHSYLGKNLTKLSDAEIAANRNGAFGRCKGRRGRRLCRQDRQRRAGMSRTPISRRSRRPATTTRR